MSVIWEVERQDYETERRRKRLSDSQPRINWVAPLSWLAAALVSLATWRVIWLYGAAALVYIMLATFVMLGVLPIIAGLVSALRGEAGGLGVGDTNK